MNSVNDLIVHTLTFSQGLLERYTADLSPEDYLHHPVPKANCAAWIIGHLILTERKALEAAGVARLPELPEGFEKRIPREVTDTPADDYGDVTALIPLFKAHRGLLIEAVKSLTAEQLAKPLAKPHPPLFTTMGDFLNFIGHHVSMHAGQITLIRRSLGRPPVV